MPPTFPSPSTPVVPTHDPVTSIKVVFRKVANTRHYHAFLLGSTVAGRQKIIGGYMEGLTLIVEAGVLLKESAVVVGAGKGWQPFDTGISASEAADIWAKMVAKANEIKNTVHGPELTHCNAVMTTVLQATTDQQAIGYIQQWNSRRKKTAAVAGTAVAVVATVAVVSVADAVAVVAADAVAAVAVAGADADAVAVVAAVTGAVVAAVAVAGVGAAAGVGVGADDAAVVAVGAVAVVAAVGAVAVVAGVAGVAVVVAGAVVVPLFTIFAGAGAVVGVVVAGAVAGAGAVVVPVTKGDIPGIGNMLMAKTYFRIPR